MKTNKVVTTEKDKDGRWRVKIGGKYYDAYLELEKKRKNLNLKKSLALIALGALGFGWGLANKQLWVIVLGFFFMITILLIAYSKDWI